MSMVAERTDTPEARFREVQLPYEVVCRGCQKPMSTDSVTIRPNPWGGEAAEVVYSCHMADCGTPYDEGTPSEVVQMTVAVRA